MEGWVDLGYLAMHRPVTELAISQSLVRRPNHYTNQSMFIMSFEWRFCVWHASRYAHTKSSFIYRPWTVCVHRNERQQTPNKPRQHEANDYITPRQTRQAQQPQHDVIPLEPTQQADQYATLNPITQGVAPLYDVLAQHTSDRLSGDSDYVNLR